MKACNRFRSVLAAGMAAVICGMVLAGCNQASVSSGGAGTAGKSNVAAVKDMGNGTYEVTVAVLDGMAPYTYTDENGKMQGYDYEWMQAVDKKLDKYTFKYVSVSPDAAPAAIQAGTYAMSASAHFVTDARKEGFILSIPESYYPVNLISRASDKFTKFEDLDGKTLVPNPPNDGLSVVLAEMAKKYPNVHYTQDPTSEYIPYQEGMEDVVKGKYDCWFGGETMYKDIVKATPELGQSTYCSDPITTAGCVAVINKNLTDLREAINEATCALYKDGTLKSLSEKWLGKDYFEIAKNTGSLFDYDSYDASKADWYKDK